MMRPDDNSFLGKSYAACLQGLWLKKLRSWSFPMNLNIRPHATKVKKQAYSIFMSLKSAIDNMEDIYFVYRVLISTEHTNTQLK